MFVLVYFYRVILLLALERLKDQRLQWWTDYALYNKNSLLKGDIFDSGKQKRSFCWNLLDILAFPGKKILQFNRGHSFGEVFFEEAERALSEAKHIIARASFSLKRWQQQLFHKEKDKIIFFLSILLREDWRA